MANYKQATKRFQKSNTDYIKLYYKIILKANSYKSTYKLYKNKEKHSLNTICSV